MERTKYTTSVILLILTAAVYCFSQTSPKDQIYRAFVTGDMSMWKKTVAALELKELDSDAKKLELVEYYYGYTAWLVDGKKSKEAKSVIKKATTLIEDILENNPDEATARAFKGAFIGFTIAINPLKAPFLGQQSLDEISAALEIDPENIQARIEHANALYYRPAFFGGDKKAAATCYEHAVLLLEEQGKTEQNWIYLNVLTFLAQAYHATNQLQAARSVFEKIFEQEPDYAWVRDELYPELFGEKQISAINSIFYLVDSPHFTF
jgi:tetratricopeptide (TPR) repeat protein